MTLPLFQMGEDPGSSFVALLRQQGLGSLPLDVAAAPVAERGWQVRHGTTIAALRYSDGVVMAGDRRATEGHAIAHRRMDKVFAADRLSGIAIAGAAGLAQEMVRLFQTQLEHYEKVEGSTLSLEGKANQLGQLVRSNLPMAMEGLAVIPLFAGFDARQRTGRIFTYDVTGGRYEETDYHATGSGGRDAKATIKLGWSDTLTRDEAVELLVRALYEAADEDSATGGPDPLRGIYPIVAVVDANGFARLGEEEVASRFAAVLEVLDAEGSRRGRRAPSPDADAAGPSAAPRRRGGRTS